LVGDLEREEQGQRAHPKKKRLREPSWSWINQSFLICPCHLSGKEEDLLAIGLGGEGRLGLVR
jgi:hypothetical protein